jgi:hypothetical protein
LTYVVITGLFLVITFVALISGTEYEEYTASRFPFVDLFKLDWVFLDEGKEIRECKMVKWYDN